MSSQGDSWQIGVAIPIKNNKFIFGQNYNGVLSQEVSSLTTKEFLYSNTLYPEMVDVVQYDDSILLGPSTKSGYVGESEHIKVTGVEKYSESIHKIFSKFSVNTNKYNSGDPITIYGTGLAGGWEVPTSMKTYVTAQGIRSGAISRQFVQNYSGATKYHTQPRAGYYQLNVPIGGVDANDFRFGLDITNGISGFEYVKTPITAGGEMEFAVGTSSITELYILLGDWHRGGWRKEFAQRLGIEIKKDMSSGSIFQQSVLSYGNASTNLGEKSLVVPYQYYRIGGKVFIDTSKLRIIDYGDGFHFLFILRPHSYHREDSEYIWTYISTDSNDSNKWIDFSGISLLKSGISNLSSPLVSVWLQNNSIGSGDGYPTGYSYGHLHLYTDELWVEHAGGVNYSDQDGCLDFGRYCVWPEQGSIEIGYIEDPTSLNYKRRRMQISARFPLVSQAFWDQLEIVLGWQQRGHSINIHPYLNDVPNVLTGKISVSDIKKESWDLTKRSFTLTFIED